MSVQSKSRTSASTVAAAFGCAFLLSACSSGEEGNEAAGLIREYLTDQISGEGKPSQKRVTPEQIKLATERATQPLMLIDFPKTEANALIARIERNGSVDTYATSARQTVAFENGLIRGTRGLGGDLMSVELGALPELIAHRRSGTTQREMRFLDGEDVTVRYNFACSVVTGPQSGHPSTWSVTENCAQTDGALKFTNTYQVNSGGRVVSSQQWLGSFLGDAKTYQIKF